MGQMPATGAVLVVRVWFEPGAEGAGFRARLTRTPEVHHGGESVVVTSRREALDAVERWLDACIAAQEATDGTVE